MRDILLALFLVLLLASSCSVDRYLGSTEAYYTLPSGEKLYYKSNKNQEDFKAKVGLGPDGKLNALDISTTAITPEMAIMKFAEAQAKMADVLNRLVELIPAAAKAGALGAGS